jgi:Bifunctional DNA primase/polymerase, N-terminal/Primase C terminal 1 (PriCT-1)
MLTDGMGFCDKKKPPLGVPGGEPCYDEATPDLIATYQKHQLSLFPLRKKTKKPLSEWAIYQTRRPTDDEIKAWQDKGLLDQPAVVCGEVSGIVVLDVDDPEKFESWTRKEKHQVPPTGQARTSGGKYHLYFKHPGGKIKNSIKKIPGADIKGDGGYVVAPPSIHPNGTQYEWVEFLGLDDVELADLPEWILDYIEREASPDIDLGAEDMLPPDDDWVAVALRGVAKGERDNTAIKLSGYYIGRGEPEQRVIEMLLSWNLRNSEPLSEKAIRKCVSSAARMEAMKRIREGVGQANAQTEPEPKTDLPWEEQRQAALHGLGDLLGMPIADVKVSAGHESLWEIVLEQGVSIMPSSSEMCSQNRFHDRVFAAAVISPNRVPKAQNGAGGWRSVLRTFANYATRIDAGPEATLRGEVQGLINNWLSEYRGFNCFERGKPIPHHVAFFILKQEGRPAVFMRLDQVFYEARQMGYNISRKKLVCVLSTLGHVNQRLKWPGCDSMVWRLNMATIPDEIRSIVYKKAMFDGDD